MHGRAHPLPGQSLASFQPSHDMKFNHLPARTDIFKFSFFPRTNPIPMRNSLPQEIVHATSPASFSAGVSAWRNGSSPPSRQKQNTLRAKTKNLTTKPKNSRQNQKLHGKNKIPHGKNQKPHDKTDNLTAKPKTSRQKQNASRQNQKPHGKTKDLTAKPNTVKKSKNPRQN